MTRVILMVDVILVVGVGGMCETVLLAMDIDVRRHITKVLIL